MRAAGVRAIIKIEDIHGLGLSELASTIGRTVGAFRMLRQIIRREKPDLVILIDYAEFNLILSGTAQRNGVPVLYYITPQVWAWRRGRIDKLVDRADRLAVVLPFEAELFHRAGDRVAFVGHPLLDRVATVQNRDETLKRHGFPPRAHIISILPGSRRAEVRYLLNPMVKAARIVARDHNLEIALALAPTLTQAELTEVGRADLAGIKIVENDTYNIVAASELALVASGTATLETALLGCPEVIAYKVSAAYLYSGADACDGSGFYRDAQHPRGPQDRAGIDPARRDRREAGARGRTAAQRHDPRGNGRRTEGIAREARLAGCGGTRRDDRARDDRVEGRRMKLLTPLQWRLFGYLRRYLFPYVLLLGIAMGVLSAASAGIPLIIKMVVDLVTNLKVSHQLDAHGAMKLREYSLGLAGLFMLRALANFTDDYLSAYISQKLTMDIRADLNESLQRQSLSFFNRTPTGVMVSRVISDVGLVVSSLSGGIFSIFGDGMSLIALLVTAFWLDWHLAILAFIGFPIVVLPIASLSKKVRRETKNQQKQLSGLQSLLHETFQGNRVVKAFGMEDYERARFNRELKRLFRIFMRVARIKAFTGPLIEALGAIAVVAVVWWAVGSLQAGTRTLGQFAGFFTTMILVYRPFKALGKTNNSIQQGLAAAERVFEMMDLPSEVPDDPDGIDLQPGAHSVAFENVSFRYGDEWVLHDINLAIGAGKVVALVGMSGGGKSTMADLIPRFYDVQQGRVSVDGIDVRKLRLKSLRAEIGLVTQSTFLFDDTIRANIAYGSSDKKLERVIAAAKLANAHDFISRLPNGYETMVGELGVRISGGERQRIAIARALLKDAPILILDEATSSLDSAAERSVQEALEHLMANRTTLVIAHRLSTVRRADRIVVVVHGRIVEEGTHDELFARGREYRKLYDLQFMSPEDLAGNGGLVN